MAKYGRRSSKRSYGGKRGYKKRGFKTKYRKLGSSRSKLYRTGGNFAAPGVSRAELKSFDMPAWNALTVVGDVWGAAVAAGTNPSRTLTGINVYGASSSTANALWAPGSALLFTGVATSNSIGTGNSVVPLNHVAAGYNVNQRIGRKLLMKSVEVNMTIGVVPANAIDGDLPIEPGVTSNPATVVRVMLVYDRQYNGVLPYKGDILSQIGDAGMNGSQIGVHPESALNLNTRDRFLVVCDKKYNLDGIDRRSIHVRIFKKLKLPVIFNAGVTQDPTCISTGALLLVPVSEGPNTFAVGNATQALACPYAFWPVARVRFVDS